MKRLEVVLAFLLGLALLFAAVARFFSSQMRNEMADSLNVPVWFLLVVSVIEIVIAIDLFLPRFRILGGVGAGLTMIGATIFNIFGEKVGDADPQQGIPVTIILAIIGFLVAWLAAGKPSSIGSLIETAKWQLKGQFDDLSEATSDLV